MSQLYFLDADSPQFPPSSVALDEPKGLLAVGGNLRSQTLLDAYSKGIFPWFSDDQPIMWWSPSPRMVITPRQFRPSQSLRKLARKDQYAISCDRAFLDVIKNCARQVRTNQHGTWITNEMRDAYIQLHRLGHAHSVEVWRCEQLVGGLYGVAIGSVFFGESMFSRESNTSKLAFANLCHNLSSWDFGLIDCQVYNPHLASLGAYEISRDDFEKRLASSVARSQTRIWRDNWQSGISSND